MVADKKFKDVKRRLLAMKEETLALSSTASASRKPVELDQQSVGRLSRMDAIQGQAMQLETERRRQTDLTRIEAALQRIEEGEFGYCVACGEEIQLRRLEYDPSVATCVDCAGG